MTTLVNKIAFTLIVVAALAVGWMVGDIKVDVSPYPPPAETAYPGPVIYPTATLPPPPPSP